MSANDYSGSQNPGSDYSGAQHPDSLYVAKAGKAGAPSKPKFKSPRNGEVTILALFQWDPPIDEATEITLLLDGKWHPGYEDYVATTGVTMPEFPGDLAALLGVIVEYAPRSIKRLNFFTHSNKTMIGIRGTIDPGNVYFTEAITSNDLTDAMGEDKIFEYKKHSFVLDDVRQRFTDDAVFVLYGCDAAFDPTTLLTGLADLLQVTTIGFRAKMIFCPPGQTRGGTRFNRKGERVGIDRDGFTCAVNATSDWRSLINDPAAVRVTR